MLTPVSEAQLAPGTFYVKTGDDYYAVARGILYSTDEKDSRIPTAANPDTRMLLYYKDDSLIPTMYEDSQLVYTTAEGELLPELFTIERYMDQGYSIGIRGLSDIYNNGKYHTVVNGATFYPGTSIANLKVKQGDDLSIDKIGGTAITAKMISPAGTILNLDKGSYYQVDAYKGTKYIGMEAQADTHMFTSFELFKVARYELNQTGYMQLKFPLQLQSGYYYVEGAGLFRFVHKQSTDDTGYEDVDFNIPYYIGKTKDGKDITNPVEGFDSENGLADGQDDYSWRYTINVPEGQDGLAVSITYTNSTDPLQKSIPTAFIEDPDGNPITFENTPLDEPNTYGDVTYNEGVLKMFEQSPAAGKWVVHMAGMSGRQYNINVGTSPEEEAGAESANLNMRVARDLRDGTFHFTWENVDRTAVFELTSPSGKVYSTLTDQDKVTSRYGVLDYHIGTAEMGDWKISINGGNLGKVWYYYTEAGDDSTDETEEPEIQEATSDEDENPEGEEGDGSDETDSDGEKPDEPQVEPIEGPISANPPVTTGGGSGSGSGTGTGGYGTGSGSGSGSGGSGANYWLDYNFAPALNPANIVPHGGMLIDGTIIDTAPADHTANWPDYSSSTWWFRHAYK